MSKDRRDFEIWVASTESALRQAYCIDFNDIGFSDEQIVRYWEMEFSPNEFVEWFGEEYALIEIESPDIFFRREIRT